MIDLGSKTDIFRLHAAIDGCRDALRPHRTNRTQMLREYVGSWYGEKSQGAPNEVLVNLLGMTAEAYTVGLAAQNPRCRVTTPYRDLWPFAYRWQTALNNFIKEIRFQETLQQIVLDAFFTLGIGKVFQGEWKSIQLEDDVWADPGRPYFCRISFDDFGFDISAKDVRKCQFMWDEYRVSWDAVRNNPDFDKSVVKQLAPTSKWDSDDERARDISAGLLTDDDELEPKIDLMDVWLPELGVVAVFPRHVRTKPLKVVADGPEGGPYPLLTFADVPDNVLPTTPAQNLMGLHLLYNGLMRKQERQARRQKTNPIYRPSAAEDAKRHKNARDGEYIRVGDPSALGVMTVGGVAPENQQFSMVVYDLFSKAAGNLEARGGLGAQAPTYGQEQLIYQQVGRKEAQMQGRNHAFVARVLGSIGHLMWADTMLEVPGSVEIVPGSGIHVDMSWTPEMREGDFWQYNFDLVPLSTNYEPPEAKVEKLERAMAQVERLFPAIQASGGMVDAQEFIKQYAESIQLPELENIITFATQQAIERPGPQGQEQGMPATTTRNYVRRNVPTGGTPQSRSLILQQALLGQNTSSQQRASMTRPVA